MIKRSHTTQLLLRLCMLVTTGIILGLTMYKIVSVSARRAEEASWKATTIETTVPLAQSTIIKRTLPFLPNGERSIVIYLPKGYSTTHRYHTLYLLHGSPGGENDWIESAHADTTLDAAIEGGTLPPTIVVFPDGNGGRMYDTQYIDATDVSQLNETFIVKNVVEYVDSHYRTITKPNGRAIGGLSSGGFGSINIGLRHQDIFGEIVSFSGYGAIEQSALTQNVIQHSQNTIDANSPLTYISKLTSHTIKTLLINGTSDPYVEPNKQLNATLLASHFDVTLTFFEGNHGWKLWTDHLIDGLAWLGTQWRSTL